MKTIHCSIQKIVKVKNRGIKSRWRNLGLFIGLLLSGAALTTQAANFGIQWVGTGVPLTDAGGAFGVPTANWLMLTTPNGTQTYSPPSGGAITVTWSTGGGQYGPGSTFSGFSTGENQVLSGCLYAMQNDTECGGPISVTISGLSSVALGSYTLQLMASINGSGPSYTFQPAIVNGTDTLNFNNPVAVAGNATSIASVTTNLTESGDGLSFHHL